MDELAQVHLSGLRAVEAVARLGSLRAAADALGVTPGAVSQQIGRTEAALDVRLFERHAGGMRPTPLGREIAARFGEGFARLAEGVRLARRERSGVLTVSVAPLFAARWLIWRLPAFAAAHPRIKVRLDAGVGLVDPGRSDVDLCIRNGPGNWPGVRSEYLFPQVVFPVCSAAIARRLTCPADLAHVLIIRETNANFTWDDWLAPEGLSEAILGDGPVFSDASLCFDAAIMGQGVFLTFETLALDALARGSIVAPFPARRPTRNGYYLVTSLSAEPRPPARRFIAWLKAELAGAGLGAVHP